MELIHVGKDEFKESIYDKYLKLFPKQERKPYKTIEQLYDRGILSIVKITSEDKFIGFMLNNKVKGTDYLHLDYLAILPEFQGKGYGTKTLELLKENSLKCKGIYLEAEKIGLGKNDKENEIRKRRASFYENMGFYNLNFDINLYGVIFTPYILQIAEQKEAESKIIKDIENIYITMLGKEGAEKNIKIIKVK